MRGRPQNLADQRFGMLVAKGTAREGGILKWLCDCDCGGRTSARATDLLAGRKRSCGCHEGKRMTEESAAQVIKKAEHERMRRRIKIGDTPTGGELWLEAQVVEVTKVKRDSAGHPTAFVAVDSRPATIEEIAEAAARLDTAF